MRDRAVILLPEPCLVVLLGAAGAGKSTFADRWFTPDEVLSSDAYRAVVSGDPADQRATGAAFRALHRALRGRLEAGRLSVVDATNVTPGARSPLLRAAAVAGLPTVAIVLDLPPSVVLARNAARRGGLAIPPEAVRRQLDDLARTLASGRLAREGFAAIWRIRSAAALDAAVVRRFPAPRGRAGAATPPRSPAGAG